MKNDFTLAFNEIMDARALSREVVLDAISQALVSAYKRDANIGTKQRIEANIDLEGQPHIYVEKEVVPDVISEQTEVSIEEALERFPDTELGEMVMMPVTNTSSDFGRIAAQTAKQVILQRIREAERESLYEEFIEREGDLITGTVQSIIGSSVTLSLGRAEATMPKSHQIRGEKYRQHDKIRTYVVEVNKSSRGPQIIVSRAHKDMLRRLLEYEVPEIYNGQVEIKNIAREPGARSKVAVSALQEGIDPVGACVGMRGMRIQNIIKELHNEKIDVIEWDADPKKFIAKSLSPARVTGVYLDDDIDQLRTATVIVPDDQLSLAIGKEGQNARLAAKLTNWRIDIKNVTESAIENLSHIDGSLSSLRETHPEVVTEAERIIEKKRANRPIMPEEFNVLIRFVDIAETAKLVVREHKRKDRRTRLDSVRDLVPAGAFEMPISTLELADDINEALSRIENVGELMVRVLSDEDNLAKMLRANKAGDDAMEAIRYALDDLVIPELTQSEKPQVQPEPEVAPDEIEVAAPVVEASVAVVEEAIDTLVVDGEIITPAEAETEIQLETTDQFDDDLDIDDEKMGMEDGLTPEMWPEDETEEERRARKKKAKARAEREAAGLDLEPEEAVEEDDDEPRRDKKKDKRRKVQLVYDEDKGEVVAKRRRKGNRRREQDFDELDF